MNQNNFSGNNYFIKSISNFFNVNQDLLVSGKLKIQKFIYKNESHSKLIKKIISSLESVE